MLVTKSLETLLTTGRLDLADNAAIIDYAAGNSPASSIRAALQAGYNNGAWNGHGIISSVAVTNRQVRVGFAEATDLFGTFPASFAGQTVDDTSLLLHDTLIADANLDGRVDTLDFNALAGNFGAADQRWSQGDFNYDGVVNTLDFNALAGEFGKTLAPVTTQRIPVVFSRSAIVDERPIALLTGAASPV